MTWTKKGIWYLVASFLLASAGLWSCEKDPASPSGKSVPPTDGILYATSYTHNCILVFDNAKNADGVTVPDRVVVGAATGLSSPSYNGLFVDSANDRLYVSNNGTVKSVGVFYDASTLNGDAAPSQLITGAATGLTSVYGVCVRGDRIYVANGTDDNILVFDIDAVGNTAPIAVITADNMFRVYDVYVDADGSMYVGFALTAETPSWEMSQEVKVFGNVDELTGNHHRTPSRIITSSFLYTYPASVWVDEARDQLFVSLRNRNTICVYNNASTLDGAHDPDYSCSTGMSYPMTITHDGKNNVLYQVQDNNSFIVNSWDNASAITDRAPDRTITTSVHQQSIYAVAVDPHR